MIGPDALARCGSDADAGEPGSGELGDQVAATVAHEDPTVVAANVSWAPNWR